MEYEYENGTSMLFFTSRPVAIS